MNRKDLRQHLINRLDLYENDIAPIPALRDSTYRATFIEQLVDSKHRVDFIKLIKNRPIGASRIDPNSPMFDPLHAAIHYLRHGNLDEAHWLIFLFTHFGKNLKHGYSYTRYFYGQLYSGRLWSWAEISAFPSEMAEWITENADKMRGLPGAFGNHRKYQSIESTVECALTYVDWVQKDVDFASKISRITHRNGGDPEKMFAQLYKEMSAVKYFGRTAKFDYLTMLGKTGIASIKPDAMYLQGATGPKIGIKLLFNVHIIDTNSYERKIKILAQYLGVGPQEMEDAICNWQKKPGEYEMFKG